MVSLKTEFDLGIEKTKAALNAFGNTPEIQAAIAKINDVAKYVRENVHGEPNKDSDVQGG